MRTLCACSTIGDCSHDSQPAFHSGKSTDFAFAETVNAIQANSLPTLKQDEDADEDDWNCAMAAATCLSLLAQTTKDSILNLVLPFVEANIKNADWHKREAAVMAFGSILNGPDPERLGELASQALPVLIGMMKDPSDHVKDSVAWTLGHLAEVVPTCLNVEVHLAPLIMAFGEGLSEEPKIIVNCCWVWLMKYILSVKLFVLLITNFTSLGINVVG